ncbi:MAG: hypothetical protein AMXMBFR47_25880 [Planctomycetota bacterium]
MLRDIPPDILDDALRAVLAPPGASNASRAALRTFRDYLAAMNVRCGGVYDPDLGPQSSAVAVRLPGRSAVALVPFGDPARYAKSLEALLAQLRASELVFVQALIEPDASGKAAALNRAGFRRITQMIYLERDATYPWVDPPAPHAVWIPYAPATHARFRTVIERSYIDSADCPELTTLRTTDDAIASHAVAGVSGSEHWELLSIDGLDAGALLLSTIAGPRAIEVTYMGLVPELRGRRLGGMLLQRALQRARALSARLVTIVVDERNTKAHALYERFGFRAVAARDAYLLACQNDAPRAAQSCG